MVHVEDVLRERLNDYEARELAEQLLEIGSCARARRARSRSSTRRATRSAIWCACWRSGSRRSMRAADPRSTTSGASCCAASRCLRDERLHDDQGALDALGASWCRPIRSTSRRATRLLDDRAARRGARARRRSAVAARDARRTAGDQGRDPDAGRRASTRICWPTVKRAEDIYRRVLELDPRRRRAGAAGGARARAHLRRLRESRRSSPRCCGRRSSSSKTASHAARAARAARRALRERCSNDSEGAIAAWRHASEENPDDERALAALDRLYEATRRFRDLVNVMRAPPRRQPATRTLRRRLMTRAARDAVDEARRGARSDRRLPERWSPSSVPSRDALSALEALFASAERWDELAETYEQHLDIVRHRRRAARAARPARRPQARAPGRRAVGARSLPARARHRHHAPGEPRRARAAARVDGPGPRREAARVLAADLRGARATTSACSRRSRSRSRPAEDPLTSSTASRRRCRSPTGRSAIRRAPSVLPSAACARRSATRDLVPWLEHLERLARRHRASDGLRQAAVRGRAGHLRRRRSAHRHAQDRRVWRATSWPIAIWPASTTRRRSSCVPTIASADGARVAVRGGRRRPATCSTCSSGAPRSPRTTREEAAAVPARASCCGGARRPPRGDRGVRDDSRARRSTARRSTRSSAVRDRVDVGRADRALRAPARRQARRRAGAAREDRAGRRAASERRRRARSRSSRRALERRAPARRRDRRARAAAHGRAGAARARPRRRAARAGLSARAPTSTR